MNRNTAVIKKLTSRVPSRTSKSLVTIMTQLSQLLHLRKRSYAVVSVNDAYKLLPHFATLILPASRMYCSSELQVTQDDMNQLYTGASLILVS